MNTGSNANNQNESFSQVLIDRALWDSGWDLLNSKQVQFEYHHLSGRADYLLKDSLGRGLSAYGRVRTTTRPTLVGCWSHARRYFHDLIKARPKAAPPGLADEALTHIDALFHLEQCWKETNTEQRRVLRQHYSAPILEQFKAWLEQHLLTTAPKTMLGKGIRYTLRFWTRLTQFLRDGRLVLSNNATERAIKAFVIGCKAWLFSAVPARARALANLYAVVETAKTNGVNPWTYLKNVFTALPSATTIAQIEALLALAQRS